MGWTKQQRCEYNKAWNKRNPEKARAIWKKGYLKNRVKRLLAVAKWRKKNPNKYNINGREVTRFWRWGLLQADIDVMVKEQNNKCSVCGECFTRTPHIDHCHTTGLIRGLLCFRCNILLGMARDRISVLKQAIVFLTKAKRRHHEGTAKYVSLKGKKGNIKRCFMPNGRITRKIDGKTRYKV